MKRLAFVTFFCLSALAAASTAPGQGDKLDPSQPQWGAGVRYNPAMVEVLQGEVVAVDTYTIHPSPTGLGALQPPPGRTLMTLKTDRETVRVFLASSAFVEAQDVKIAVKDKVEVKGSRVMYQGEPYILAVYVKKGVKILRLRDDSGLPRWPTRPRE